MTADEDVARECDRLMTEVGVLRWALAEVDDWWSPAAHEAAVEQERLRLRHDVARVARALWGGGAAESLLRRLDEEAECETRPAIPDRCEGGFYESLGRFL